MLDLMNDTLHQPVTLLWPTDQAMAALPQEQKDFLYNIQNRDKLTEYLKYHVIRDAMVSSSCCSAPVLLPFIQFCFPKPIFVP